jgi:hypothetical protein
VQLLCSTLDASFLRQSRHAHALVDALPLGQNGCIIAPHGGAEAGNGESRIGGKASLNGGSRFLQPTEVCQGRREVKLCDWVISIDFAASVSDTTETGKLGMSLGASRSKAWNASIGISNWASGGAW